jgi:glycerol uptake facilitator protein
MIGMVFVWLSYGDHWKETEDADGKLACFATAPAIRDYKKNFVTEVIGTAMLICGVIGITSTHNGLGAGIAPLLVGFLVLSIGLSLGGPTGYAINPARDLGPRIMHAILPIPGKRDSDWGYAWVPVVAPLIGGVLGAFVYNLALSLIGK